MGVYALWGDTCSLCECGLITASNSNTKLEVNSERKVRYYTTVLSGKEDHGLWSASTAEHFASSTALTRYTGKLIRFGDVKSCWDFVYTRAGCKCKSLPALLSKELTNCCTYTHQTTVIFATQNGVVVSDFPSTIRFMFCYIKVMTSNACIRQARNV